MIGFVIACYFFCVIIALPIVLWLNEYAKRNGERYYRTNGAIGCLAFVLGTIIFIVAAILIFAVMALTSG